MKSLLLTLDVVEGVGAGVLVGAGVGVANISFMIARISS